MRSGSDNNGRRKPKLALSVILGMALIPLSAIGAVLLTGQGGEAAAQTTGDTIADNPPAVTQIAYSGVEASADDLAYACGKGGKKLVKAEDAGTITDLQQSALDALREICDSQGTPLPGKEAPPPIVETRFVTVEATTGPATTQTTSDQGAGEVESEPEQEFEPEETTSTSAPSTNAPMGSEERYLAVHDQAVNEIAYAVSVGGSSEKIDEARAKLREAERAAEAGHWEEATTQAYEAIGKAREAVGGEGGGDD